jgi:Xaa-Pro dipeptidase
MTQNDFAGLVSAAHARLGFSGGAGVQVGEYSALPHGSIQPQIVKEGSILLIDGGCSVEGYSSDISRTFVLGKPTDKMKRLFEIERRAQDAALAAAKPGVACEAVDAASMQGLARITSTSRTASATASAWTSTNGRTSSAATRSRSPRA